MKFDIGAIFEQIINLYIKLPLAQKIALPLLLTASMGVVVWVSNWATRPSYSVLYSNLEEADAASVVERLKDNKISYRLGNDGRTIEVSPPSIVHDVRLEMAGMGLPKGSSVGLELFNEPKLGQTALSEQINQVRAMSGELERTIGAIEAVRAVRVHIATPKRSVFAKRDVPPTASVLVKLKAGSELTPIQIKGIAHLVAGSVERLTPENVTILDQNGKMLNEKPTEEAKAGLDLTRLQFQREVESALSKRIETMLSEILGPGRVVARVTADMDFSKMEKEEEAFDPAGIVTRSERESQEGTGVSSEGGVSGVVSNLTNDVGVLSPPDSGKNGNIKKESVKNFEISRAISKTSNAPGKVQRLSVAVLVDGQRVDSAPPSTNPADPKPMKVYQPLNTEMLKKMENLVKQAVGFDPARGDIVTVENIKFMEPDPELEQELTALESRKQMFSWVSMIVPLVLILLFMLIVVRPLVRFLVTPSESEVDLSRLLPAGIEELEAELEAERSKISTLPEVSGPTIDIEELEGLLGENSRLVRENPQQAALLIRYWLNDGRM